MMETPERSTLNDLRETVNDAGPAGRLEGHYRDITDGIGAGEPSEALAGTEILLNLSARMSDLHRPFAALRCLDRAEDICGSAMGAFDHPSELDIGFEHCRAKKAECLLGMVEDVPEEYRPLLAIAGSSYLNCAVENLIGLGDIGSLEHYCGWLKASELYKRAYPISQHEIDRLNRTTAEGGYPAWCRENQRYLSIVDAVPDVCTCDDIGLDLDEERQWLLEDVTGTYDHCRRLFYRVAEDPSKVAAGLGRDDVECVVDCCVRLYTLLDKTAGLIAYMFPYGGSEEYPRFRDVAEAFGCSPNPYLRSMRGICGDVFPDGTAAGWGSILNGIIRGTLRVADAKEGAGDFRNVAVVTPAGLVRCADVLMCDVREVLLNLVLAVEYSRNHRSDPREHRPDSPSNGMSSDNRTTDTLYAGADTFLNVCRFRES